MFKIHKIITTEITCYDRVTQTKTMSTMNLFQVKCIRNFSFLSKSNPVTRKTDNTVIYIVQNASTDFNDKIKCFGRERARVYVLRIMQLCRRVYFGRNPISFQVNIVGSTEPRNVRIRYTESLVFTRRR